MVLLREVVFVVSDHYSILSHIFQIDFGQWFQWSYRILSQAKSSKIGSLDPADALYTLNGIAGKVDHKESRERYVAYVYQDVGRELFGI